MQGLAYISLSSGLPVIGANVFGDLKMIQKQPLDHKGHDLRYAQPLFNSSSIFAEAFNFKKVIDQYSQRNGNIYFWH